jgi:hypothetical protein
MDALHAFHQCCQRDEAPGVFGLWRTFATRHMASPKVAMIFVIFRSLFDHIRQWVVILGLVFEFVLGEIFASNIRLRNVTIQHGQHYF